MNRYLHSVVRALCVRLVHEAVRRRLPVLPSIWAVAGVSGVNKQISPALLSRTCSRISCVPGLRLPERGKKMTAVNATVIIEALVGHGPCLIGTQYPLFPCTLHSVRGTRLLSFIRRNNVDSAGDLTVSCG